MHILKTGVFRYMCVVGNNMNVKISWHEGWFVFCLFYLLIFKTYEIQMGVPVMAAIGIRNFTSSHWQAPPLPSGTH